MFRINDKVQVNNTEIFNRLSDEVELVEFVDLNGREEVIFDEEFQDIYDFIEKNVKCTYIDKEEFYINSFYLELINGGQSLIRIV